MLFPDKTMKHISSGGNLLDDEDIPEEIKMRETNMQNLANFKHNDVIEEEEDAFEEIELDDTLNKIEKDSNNDDVISDYVWEDFEEQ